MPKTTAISDYSFPENFEHIKDIPWDKSPALFMSNGQEYLDAVEIILGKKPPVDELKISFKDNVWNFNPYMATVNSQKYCIRFYHLPDQVAEYCKFFVLYKITQKRKIRTVQNNIDSISVVLRDIFKKKSVADLCLITFEDIQTAIENSNNSIGSKKQKYSSMLQFFSFLKDYYHLYIPTDMEQLEETTLKYSKQSRKSSEKTPNIPNDFFNLILNTCLEVMRNEDENSNSRMMAATIIFLSQTGLRISDFLSLKVDALQTKMLAKRNCITHYIHYQSHKPTKAGQPLCEFNIFASELTTEAFKTILELRKNSPLSAGSDFLFILKPTKVYKNFKALPHNEFCFKRNYFRFFYDYMLKDVSVEREGISSIKFYDYPKAGCFPDAKPVIMWIPKISQYRVHLSTELYNKGIPLTYIERFLGHLSSSMAGFYTRPKDTYQENVEFSEQVIEDIAGEDMTPLGGSFLGEQLKKNIKKYIDDNGFNVHDDIDKIMKSLGDRTVIRGKPGGICIRTTFLPCSKDANVDKVLCAYGKCPFCYHTFNMADITLTDFHTLEQSYTIMRDSGHKMEAEKELSKIKDVINRRLIPELDELDKEIDRNGVTVVIGRHPNLKDIIKNEEGIRKDAETWLTM